MSAFTAKLAPLGLILWAFGSGTAFAGACDGSESPSVVVSSPPQPVVIDRSRGISELTNMMGPNESLANSGFLTLGITSVDYNTSVKSSVQIKKSRFSDWCAYPLSIVVTHAFSKPITVYIAKEIPEGSCKYQKTLEHEMKHVKYHQDGLLRASVEIDRALSTAARESFPISGGSSEEVSKVVSDKVSEIVSAAVRDVSASVKASNDAMDTPDAYRAFSALCRE